jgi:RNA polymerase sigma factor (sigma-70 family)
MDEFNVAWTWEWLQEHFHGTAAEGQCPLMCQVMADDDFAKVFVFLLAREAKQTLETVYLHSSAGMDEDDVASDIMCKVLSGRCRGYLAARKNLKSYFKTVVINQILYIRRRVSKLKPVNIEDIEEALRDSAPSPSAIVEHQEMQQELEDALNELRTVLPFPEEETALVFDVLVYGNLKYEDASTLFEIPIKLAYRRCFEAKEMLRKILERRGVIRGP